MFDADAQNSFLIPQAQDVYDMRYAALWKKAVNIEYYREKVSEAMKELDQRSKDLFVRPLSAQEDNHEVSI